LGGGPQARAFTLIGFLMGIQLLFGLLFGGNKDWVADFAGFAAGFGLSFLVSPGGWGRVVDRLRQR
jgi:membrane associated rhomboid family serine protease